MGASIWDSGSSIQATANADNTIKTQSFVATASQAEFTLTNFTYAPNTGSILVTINGVVQRPVADFTETSSTKVTLTSGVEAGDIVQIIGLVGSTGATAAQASASAAASSASAAALSEANAAQALTDTQLIYDTFDDRWLGPKTADPTTDNDGNALLVGAIYWNTALNVFKVWNGVGWDAFNYIIKTGPTGSAVVPVGTDAQRDAVPQAGYIRYNTTQQSFEGYNGTSWGSIGGGAKGAPGNAIFYENDQTVTGDYTIPGTKNAMSAGPITINTGVTVTVSPGATWAIV